MCPPGPSQGHGLGRYGPALRGLGEICSFRDDPVAHRDSHLIIARSPIAAHLVIGQIVAGNPHVRTCERILKPGDLPSGQVLAISPSRLVPEPTIGRRTVAAGIRRPCGSPHLRISRFLVVMRGHVGSQAPVLGILAGVGRSDPGLRQRGLGGGHDGSPSRLVTDKTSPPATPGPPGGRTPRCPRRPAVG